MKPFLHAHATHPQPGMALALAAAQIEAQRQAGGQRPTLGWLYLTAAFAGAAEDLLAELRLRWPGVAWVGAVGVGITACGVEYFDEPALALMLAELPSEQFRVFSGAAPLGRWPGACALVHADGSATELQELLPELAGRMSQGYLFGGLACAPRAADALHLADGVWRGGLSGVAFGDGIELISRVTQGCRPLGAERRIDACDGPLLLELDGQPALDCLLEDLALPALTAGYDWHEAMPRLRQALVGLRRSARPGPGRPGAIGDEVLVRHVVGLDPARRGVAVAEQLEPGQHLSFCERHREAARRDLVRICAEIREQADGRPLLGGVYVSCAGRGGPHFGAPSAEAQWLRHGLGELPLVGFFAGGEIAHDRLHGYTGVLSVFVSP